MDWNEEDLHFYLHNEWCREADQLYSNGDFERAEINYKKALEGKPDDFYLQYRILGCCHMQNKWEDVVDIYENLPQTLHPYDVNWFAIARSYYFCNEYENALEIIDACLNNMPQHVDFQEFRQHIVENFSR